MATKKTTSGGTRDGAAPRSPTKRRSTTATGAPRIKASHGGPAKAREGAATKGASRTIALKPSRASAPKKAPLAPPRRTTPRRSIPPSAPEPSSQARELALVIAGAGIDKKAVGIEILDVTGKVDYADFIVVMTGRSDRHVHAIAQGLEESVKRKQNLHALSVEGLAAATWVLIDFGDVVVHVFQEEARRVYDIEGLWIDASRLPVPETEHAGPPEAV